jgi:porin
MKGVITIVKNISHNMQSPHNRPVIIVVWAFLMAGLPAGVGGRELAAQNAGAEEGAAKVEKEVSAVQPVSDKGDPVVAGGPSGTGHIPLNRRTYLRPHPERDTLTNHYFGLGPKLTEAGIESTLNLWALYQAVVDGGLESDDGTSGFYFFANHFDLEKLVGLTSASIFARIDGSWDDSINEAVGALMPVNTLTFGDESIGLTQLWFEQDFLEKRVRIRIGKEDVSQNGFDSHGQNASFDAMPYANFQGTQFLDLGLVNNASIPFPESGPSAVLFFEPVNRFYVAAAGVSTTAEAFTLIGSDDFDKWMFLTETGYVAQPGGLPGLYFAGYWYSQFKDAPSARGIYLGLAQSLYREPGTKEQGLGIFARYGYATDLPTKNFWSIGAQYEGLFPGRDRDVLAIGWAQSFTTGPQFDKPYEGALESYYRACVTPWLHLSPHIQYIVNPGSSDIDNAITLGVRAQITF